MVLCDGVTKTFRRAWASPVRALAGLTLDVSRGECLGLVGANGAGKSTLLRLLLGLLRPTAGRLSIDGLAPSSYVRRFGVSYLPETIRLPDHLSVGGTLRRLGILDGLTGRRLDERVEDSLARVGLTANRRRRVAGLSRGSLQRLGIAQLLLRPRSLFLLDEPFAGLDPFGRCAARELISELRLSGDRSLIIASHDTRELERLADRVAILDGGTLRRELRLDPGRRCELEGAVREALSHGTARETGPR